MKCTLSSTLKLVIILLGLLIGHAFASEQTFESDTLNPEKFTSYNLSSLSIPNHAVILQYHHVSNDTPPITSISPDDFKRHLEYLKTNKFHIWPLDKIVNQLRSRQQIPDKVVAITFDDSYKSLYENAFPLLKDLGWPFTVFVSTDAIDEKHKHQTSWEQLRLMAKNGATIANHSSSHKHLLVKLPNETEKIWRQRIIKDIENAERRIEEEIGYSKKMFAYPYGEYNQVLQDIVKGLGYITFGQQSGPVGEYSFESAIPRFPFSGDYTDMDSFALKIMTLPLPLENVVARENPLPHRIDKPHLEIGLPLAINIDSLQCYGSLQGKLPVDNTLQKITIKPKQAIPVGRSRYNCTAAFKGSSTATRYYWYSHPWIRLDANEQWIID